MDIAQLGISIDSRQTVAATAALDKLAPAAKRAETTAVALKGAYSNASATQAAFAATTRLNTFQMQNMAYQMNDMATMLASGQSPFVMMMQQGMQISQIFGAGTGVAAALKMSGAALVAFVTNPLNLAVLGMASAAGAASLLWRSVAGSEDADDALKRHKDLIDRVVDAYGEAGEAATRYASESAAAIQFDLQNGVSSKLRDLQKAFDDLAPFGFMGRRVAPIGFGPLTDDVARFVSQFEAGTTSAAAFANSIAEIGAATNDANLRGYASDVQSLLRPLVDLENQARQTAGALQIFSGSGAKGNFGAMGSVADDLFQGWSEMDAKDSLRGALGRFHKDLDADPVKFTSATRAVAEAQREWNDQLKIGRDIADSFFGGLSRDLRNGVSAVDALGSALNRLADKLLDMALENAINGLFKNLTGFIGGGIGGGSLVSSSVGVFHNGGIAGAASTTRNIHPAYFDDAPRYHNGGIAGLKPNEVPAILERGERVIPKGTGGGDTFNYSTTIDARGASVEAVSRIESLLAKDKAEFKAKVKDIVRNRQNERW